MRLLKIATLSGTLNQRTMIVRTIGGTNHNAQFTVLFVLFLGFLPSFGFGQTYGNATNIVTVNVQPVTVLQISSGIINLSIAGSNAVAGQDQMMTTDQTSTLLWGTNSSLKKITASTSLAAPLFTLKLVALSPTVGTSAPQVTLSTTANDLLLNIGRSSGSCGLQYTAVALASQGTGTDSHTITFTVQTQ
jgi:hypothetical protein